MSIDKQYSADMKDLVITIIFFWESEKLSKDPNHCRTVSIISLINSLIMNENKLGYGLFKSFIDVCVIEKLQSKTYLPFLFLSSVCGSRASRALYFSGDVIFKDKQRIIATVSYNGNGLAAFPISIFIG